jgi:TetR/AcrR family transcriptional regulator, mexJK operon transcriptional repressor
MTYPGALQGVNEKPYGMVVNSTSMAETETGGSGSDQRRGAILKIAHAAFLKDGYAATSMSRIAAKLGGSKSTLYNYFSTKEELFAAVIDEKCRDVQAVMFAVELDPIDFRKTFANFVERVVRLSLLDNNIATHRLITAEAARFPELGRAFYMSGRHDTIQMLANYFESAQKAGSLKAADPSEMAALFGLLCRGKLFLQKLWNVTPEPSEEEIKAEVEQTVSVFLAVYGPV